MTNPNEVTDKEVDAACRHTHICPTLFDRAFMRRALEQFAQSRSATSDAADAARYRWLRSALTATDGTFFIGVDSPVFKGTWALEGKLADEAIDAAIAAGGSQP